MFPPAETVPYCELIRGTQFLIFFLLYVNLSHDQHQTVCGVICCTLPYCSCCIPPNMAMLNTSVRVQGNLVSKYSSNMSFEFMKATEERVTSGSRAVNKTGLYQ